MSIDSAERQVITGALGLLHAAKPYRNHYYAPDGGPTLMLLESMTERGLMERALPEKRKPSRWFYVTPAGAAAVGHELPKD